MAVSVFIRLGFAHKKNDDVDQSQLHPSWTNIPSPHEEAPPNLLTSPLVPSDFGGNLTSSPEGDDALESTSGAILGIEYHTYVCTYYNRISYYKILCP